MPFVVRLPLRAPRTCRQIPWRCCEFLGALARPAGARRMLACHGNAIGNARVYRHRGHHRHRLPCRSPQDAKRPLPLGDILFARGLGEGSLQAEGGAIGGGPEDAKEPGEPGLVFKKPARRRNRETADQPPVSGQPNKRIGRFQAVIATSIDGRWPAMGCDSKTRYEAITAVRDRCSLRRAAARTGVSEQRELPASRRFP